MKVCKFCLVPDHVHCVPEWIDVPEGCKCYQDGLLAATLPICSAHKGQRSFDCDECGHGKKCHAQPELSGVAG